MRAFLRVAVMLLIVMVVAPSASACPMCKAALASGSGGGDLVSGFFYSILFMLSMPFLIFTGMATYMYSLVRKARAAEAAAATASPFAAQSAPPQAVRA